MGVGAFVAPNLEAAANPLKAIQVASGSPHFASVDGVLYLADKLTLLAFPGGRSGTFVIPNGVTTIGPYAFASCRGLQKVTLPDSLTDLGSWTFLSCPIININFPAGLTSIGAGVFSSTSLTHVILPEGITSLGDYAFLKSTLRSIQLPSTLTNIGSFAFDASLSLTNIVIPDSVNSLGIDAFVDCHSLAHVTLSQGLTEISTRTFFNCFALLNVTIPASVTRIDSSAFGSCSKLTTVFFEGDAPLTSSDAFTGSSQSRLYYLPDANGWASPFAGRSALLWNPLITPVGDGTSIVTNHQFTLQITGTPSIPIALQASTNPVSGPWVPFQAFNLAGGKMLLSDGIQQLHPNRFYRVTHP